MPFLNNRNNKVQPLWKKWEKITYKTGLRHGVFNVPGDKYIGEWKDNKKHGKGALYTRSGRLYEGDWERGCRHGYGILSVKQNDGNYATEYIGKWVNGKRKGYGVSHYASGSYYEGSWHRGLRYGYGRQWFDNGGFYEGQWANDKFHGLGTMVYPNGNRYEGEWSCGLKHGQGHYFHLDSGQLQLGVWDNGVAVCSTLVDIYYRQSALEPTAYPIPKCELVDVDGVYNNREDSVLVKQREIKEKQNKGRITVLPVRSREIKKSLSCSTTST